MMWVRALNALPTLSAARLSAQTQGASSTTITLICLGGVLVVALGVLLFNELRARRRAPRSARAAKRSSLRLPAGEIVYQDTDGTAEPLFATRYPLSGKPDYVVLSPEGAPIPIELKLTTTAEEPQSNHVMQLAAYFVILEDLYEQPPVYGVLRYANRDFSIEYTDALKRKALRRLQEMEDCDDQHPPALARQLPSKCQVCPFQPICPIGKRQ